MSDTADALAGLLHKAGIRCSPNIPYCRASHQGHATMLAAALTTEGLSIVKTAEWERAQRMGVTARFVAAHWSVPSYDAALREVLETP